MTGDTIIRPLVISTHPRPDESLAGLVARATAANVLGASRIILSEVGVSLPRPGTIGRDLGDLGIRLANKIGCTMDEISHRAHPYVADTGRSAAVHWGGTQLLRSDLSLNRRRISPATLLDQDHHPASWLLSLLAFCPTSFERLIDRCPRCGEGLGWVAARGIGHCEHCRARVIHPDGETLPGRFREDYALFAHLVSIEPQARRSALSDLGPELGALPTSSIVGLVTSLGRALVVGAAEVRRDRFLSSSPIVTAQIIAVGTSVLRDWPHAFRRHLAEFYGNDDEAEQKMIRTLQHRAQDRGMEADAANALRNALPEIFTFGRKSLRSLVVPMMDPTEFRRRTGFSNMSWQKLYSSGALGPAEATGRRRASARVPRDAAERLIALKQGSEPSAALEQLLGLPTYAIEQLACIGEIDHADHPGFRILGLENRITSASAAALIADIQRPGEITPPRKAVPLLRLAARFCGGEKPWGAILSDLRRGPVRHWILPDKTEGAIWRRPLMRRVLVLPDHFDQIPVARFDRSRHLDFPFETTFSQQDAIEVLGTTAPQLKDAIGAGTLIFSSGPGNALVTDRVHVGELAQTFVGPSELGIMLRLQRNHLLVGLMKKHYAHLQRQPLGWLRDDLARALPNLFRPHPPK
ncbi:MAG: hypothetical protein K2Y20_13100 [Sphingomonas sp.]|nr:hypothetical protein [Sphingomonas sp.]